MSKITKNEIKKIFNKYNLDLDFPINSNDGSVIIDWEYKFKRVSWENSNIRKFTYLIGMNKEYRTKYDLVFFEESYKIELKLIKK